MEWILIILLLVAIAIVAVTLSEQKSAAETKYQESLSQLAAIKDERTAYEQRVQSAAETKYREALSKLTAAKEERVLYEKRIRERFGAVLDLDAEKVKVGSEIESLNKERSALASQLKTLNESIRARQADNKALEESDDLHSMGFYQPHYHFGSSQGYAAQLDVIRGKQKLMLKNKQAAHCSIEWTVNGSKVEGKKQINQTLRLLLRAFNGESDAAIAKVKYNNITVMENRIHDSFKRVNECGLVQQSSISPQYLDLKIQELRLCHEYQEKSQAEKEEQRRIQEMMREEAIAEREIQKAKEKAEKDEQLASEALEKARREFALAHGAEQEKIRSRMAELERGLVEAQQNKARAMSRAQMTRSGHVYVISNIGSFGQDVYKIGMTRRLEPMERVQELGGASVPFHFDVHAVIYADDAPALENQLHRAFDKYRVNRVNDRKEFFKVPLREIIDVVHKNHAQVEWKHEPEAKDYRQSLAKLKALT